MSTPYTTTHSTEVSELSEDGKTKGQIEGYLKYTYNLTTNQAKQEVQDVLGKGSTNNANHTAVVEFIRTNADLDKAELIAGMMIATGGKESSMSHMYNYIKFAKEYAKQEVEANS